MIEVWLRGFSLNFFFKNYLFILEVKEEWTDDIEGADVDL